MGWGGEIVANVEVEDPRVWYPRVGNLSARHLKILRIPYNLNFFNVKFSSFPV